MRETISFETTISTDIINIPEEWKDAIPVHALVMIIDIEKQGKFKPRLGRSTKKMSPPHIDTIGWKFDRDEANAR